MQPAQGVLWLACNVCKKVSKTAQSGVECLDIEQRDALRRAPFLLSGLLFFNCVWVRNCARIWNWKNMSSDPVNLECPWPR